MTADGTWSLNYTITFVVVNIELAKWCHFVQWYSANCHWLMSSAKKKKKKSNPNTAMPLQFQIYNLTQCRKPFTQWKLLHKYMPQFAVGAEHVENIEKLMRYYRKRFHRYTCISGKGSWISPSGFFFFLILGSLSYWRVIHWNQWCLILSCLRRGLAPAQPFLKACWWQPEGMFLTPGF